MNAGPKPEDGAPEPLPGGSFAAWLRGWRYFFYFLGLVLLVVLFYVEEDLRGPWAWERHQRQEEARGVHFNPKAFIPPMVPDGQNFAMTPSLAPLFGFFPGTQKWQNTNGYARIQDLLSRYSTALGGAKWRKKAPRANTWVSGPTDLPAAYAALLNSTNQTYRRGPEPDTNSFTIAEAAAGVLAELSDCEPLIEELGEASVRPHVRFNLHYDEENPAGILLPHLSVMKQLCQLAQLISSAELALGRTEPAFNHLNLALYLADQGREEPIVISQLVRFSKFQIVLPVLAQGLAEHLWSEPQLQMLQAKLEHLDLLADTRQSLMSERIFFAGTIIEYIRRSPGQLDQLSQNGSDGLGILWTVVPNGWFALERLNFDRSFSQYVLPAIDLEHHRIDPHQAQLGQEQIALQVNHSPLGLLLHHRVFSSLLLPSLPGIFMKTAASQTAVELAALACALERYRLAHGEFPEKLDALLPNLVAKLPTDVVNGLPLKYRRTAPGEFVLYSVGWNMQDDNGSVAMNKSGEGVDQQQGDWVWRLLPANKN